MLSQTFFCAAHNSYQIGVIKPPKLLTQGSCSQHHFARGNFASVLINSLEGMKPVYVRVDIWSLRCKREKPLQRTACWGMESLYKKLSKETSLTRLIAHAFLIKFKFAVWLLSLYLSAALWLFCLRWSWLQWSYWRIWLLQAAPPPCSL